MPACPICHTQQMEEECHCGYSFSRKCIVDKERLRSHMSKLKHEGNWQQEVMTKLRINQIQKKRDYDWKDYKTADLLDESKGMTSGDITLANAIERFPQLQKCANRRQAKERLRSINLSIPSKPVIPDYEIDLHALVFNSWPKIPEFEHFNLVRNDTLSLGKYNTGEVGEIDLLAEHQTKGEWLVVELKRDNPSDGVVGQTLRYMGWVKKNIAKPQDLIRGVIIAAAIDDSLYYALECTPNIEAFEYTVIEGKMALSKFDSTTRLLRGLALLSPEQVSVIIEREVEKRKQNSAANDPEMQT